MNVITTEKGKKVDPVFQTDTYKHVKKDHWGLIVGSEDAEGSFNEVVKTALKNKAGLFLKRPYIVIIYPHEAKQILEERFPNRSLRQDAVVYYSRLMKSGKFLFNGEPLVFSDTGKLMDGQHRLRALIDADKPQVFLVMFGIPEDAFPTFDNGRKRTHVDAGNIANLNDSVLVMGGAQRLYSWATNDLDTASHNPSPSECLKIIEAHPQLIESARECSKLKIRRRDAVLIHFLASELLHAKSKVEDYLFRIGDGHNLPEGDPAFAVRSLLSTYGGGKGSKKLLDEEKQRVKNCILRFLFEGWNADFHGKPLKMATLKNIVRKSITPELERKNKAIRERWSLKVSENNYHRYTDQDPGWLFGE
jgi:hypothetical protein